ncbi:hypothetical protein [Lentzea aerocolonigenes]|nr:hypothetical protein [Lentzea aerocolonigenes]
MREGKLKATERVLDEAEDERTEREDDGTWDGEFHLSVFASTLEPGEELDAAVARLFGPHRRVKFYRVATVEDLQAAGFQLAASPPEPYHYDVLLGTELTPAVVERFERCFGDARRNPAWTR